MSGKELTNAAKHAHRRWYTLVNEECVDRGGVHVGRVREQRHQGVDG